MTRDRALAILREHEADFKAKGVAHLRIFGSVARDEANAKSDVDVMVDFAPGCDYGLFALGGLQQDLCEMLGTDVDLSREPWLREQVRKRALKEAVFAF